MYIVILSSDRRNEKVRITKGDLYRPFVWMIDAGDKFPTTIVRNGTAPSFFNIITLNFG